MKLYDKSQLRKAWNDGVRMARMRVGFSDHTYTPTKDFWRECIIMIDGLPNDNSLEYQSRYNGSKLYTLTIDIDAYDGPDVYYDLTLEQAHEKLTEISK